MLFSPVKVTPDDVGDHYDQLDEFYRVLWGTVLHHGLWLPNESLPIRTATSRLLTLLVSSLSLKSGTRLVDIGCGYGADAHAIAEQTGACVSGITISRSQETKAREMSPPIQGSVCIKQGDWLQNAYLEESFDCAIAVESLSHMDDKKAFFSELYRVLAPGGRAAIACWTIRPSPSPAERLLLRILCLSGSLPSLGSTSDYTKLVGASGLSLRKSRDLTTLVEPTWGRIARKTIGSLTRPHFLLACLKLTLRRPLVSCAIPAMILAFRVGVLRYRAFWLERQP